MELELYSRYTIYINNNNYDAAQEFIFNEIKFLLQYYSSTNEIKFFSNK